MHKAAIPQSYTEIELQRIAPNPSQPRFLFDPAELQELADTIREYGVIEPITVEECGDGYFLHDGERRWRAARMAGLRVIPAIITPPLNGTGPRERLERALVSNIQRANMHPIEEGMAYRRLIDEFGYTLYEVAKKVGKHYTRIHACLTILKLEKEIQEFMLNHKMTSEARVVMALLNIPAGRERVRMAKALVERKATANTIIHACRKYLEARDGSKSRKGMGSPAVRLMSGMKNKSEWNALFQLGKVPPWPMVNDAVLATCDACALRSIASEKTCSECPLVACLRKMMEAAHAI